VGEDNTGHFQVEQVISARFAPRLGQASLYNAICGGLLVYLVEIW
jgi:hypothetical protein